MQVVNAFSFVQNSLSFIIHSYSDIAAWQAVTQRLSAFERQLLAIHQSKRAPRQIIIRRDGVGVAIKEIDIDLPDGTPLLHGVAFASAPGEAVLIAGRAVRERVRCCERLPEFGRSAAAKSGSAKGEFSSCRNGPTCPRHSG